MTAAGEARCASAYFEFTRGAGFQPGPQESRLEAAPTGMNKTWIP
jgi:hypothetical protein